mgnify:CR=1 FL=1
MDNKNEFYYNLINEFMQKHKNIIKYKMIHAKLHNIAGKLINTDIEKIKKEFIFNYCCMLFTFTCIMWRRSNYSNIQC